MTLDREYSTTSDLQKFKATISVNSLCSSLNETDQSSPRLESVPIEQSEPIMPRKLVARDSSRGVDWTKS